MIQMILTDRWNPGRLDRKIADHFELTIDEVCRIRQRPAFMAELERQRQISEQDFVTLHDRLERAKALQLLLERVPHVRTALRLKTLRRIREKTLSNKLPLLVTVLRRQCVIIGRHARIKTRLVSPQLQ